MTPSRSLSAFRSRSSGRGGLPAFTLLEIMLVITLVVSIIAMAIPSVGGFFAGEKIAAHFQAFDAMVQQGLRLAVEHREAYVIVWEERAVRLRPERLPGDDDAENTDADPLPSLERSRKKVYEIAFPAALVAEPEPIWTIWPSGTCEPATVKYEGPEGTWIARYDPLTVRPTLEESLAK